MLISNRERRSPPLLPTVSVGDVKWCFIEPISVERTEIPAHTWLGGRLQHNLAGAALQVANLHCTNQTKLILYCEAESERCLKHPIFEECVEQNAGWSLFRELCNEAGCGSSTDPKLFCESAMAEDPALSHCMPPPPFLKFSSETLQKCFGNLNLQTLPYLVLLSDISIVSIVQFLLNTLH